MKCVKFIPVEGLFVPSSSEHFIVTFSDSSSQTPHARYALYDFGLSQTKDD